MTNSGTAWQRSLLPLMAGVLIVAALFFAIQSVFEFSDFKSRVQPPKADLSAIFDRFEQVEDTKSTIARFDYLQWKSVVHLEQETMRFRYSQVNAAILARMWTRLMGFTTGMVLAIVGATFILGKLREQQTELKNETQALKISLTTSSPGIVLAVLGSFLMSITLLTKFDIDVRDVPVYVASRAQSSELPDPARLIAPEKRTGSSPEAAADPKQSDPRRGASP
jgi:ABC-type dipeptide/oligopeptide/nickel transport system permease component